MSVTSPSALSREDLIGLPAAVDLVTAARALSIGRSLAYDLAQRGEFPVRVVRLGTKYRVITSELLRYLGITPEADIR